MASSLRFFKKSPIIFFLLLFTLSLPNAEGHFLDYPDPRELTEPEGNVTFNLTASGMVLGQDGAKISVNINAQALVYQTKNNCVIKRSVHGTATGTTKYGKVQSTYSCQDEELVEKYITLEVSKKMGRVHFHGAYSAASINFPLNVKTVFTGGGNSASENTTSALTVMVPNYTFNAKDAEIDDGVFESGWNGRNTSGNCSFEVALFGGPGGPITVIPTKTLRKTGAKIPSIPGTLTVGWKWGEFPKDKMYIKPVDPGVYEKWIPAPKDGKYGPYVTLEFKAELKPDPEKPQQGKPMGRIDFYLRDISKNKGTCTNYPVASDDQTKDIRFTDDQPEGIKVDSDGLHAYTTRNDVTEATVKVEATDTGAYCTIQAVCDELGLIAEDERTKAQSIAIPLDDNQNHVADCWEQERGVFNLNAEATWDEDSSPNEQFRDGDGYTIYEEYRGFRTLKGFFRTNPRQKDLFVYDPDGLIKQWYEPYNAAKLTLHYLNPETMRFTGTDNPDNRWVNTNSNPDLWYARQYALYMHRGKVGDNGVGEARLGGRSPNPNPNPQSLKYCYEVIIDQERVDEVIAKLDWPEMATKLMVVEMTNTVIHEFGHALGIRHHSFDGREEDPDFVEAVENAEETFNTDNWDYKTVGVLDCAMRYHSQAEMFKPKLIDFQTRYCGPDEQWQLTNAHEDGTVDYYPVNLPSHNCFGQINIKCDP